MIALFATVFVASLLGSLHCVGMCGGLATLATSQMASNGNQDTKRPSRWILQLVYHFGRLSTYGLVGLIAGSLGAALQSTGDLLGWQQTSARLAGGGMALLGLLMLVRMMGGNSMHFPVPRFLQNTLARLHVLARKQSPMVRATSVGVLTVLLPCGWLYAFLITAAGTAHPLHGAAVMTAFWVGTVPALSVFLWGVHSLASRWKRALPWVSACLLTIVGFHTMTHRAAASYEGLGTTSDQITTAEQISRIDTITKQPLPCCVDAKAKAAAAAASK